jgi:integrase
MSAKPRIPSLRRHKPSGQAVVTLSGHDHYLGPWPAHAKNPPAPTKAAYDQLMAEWLANGRRQAPVQCGQAVTINELILAFWRYAEQHYRRPDGTHTNELNDYRLSLKPLRRLYGTLAAADFSPLKLKAVREQMINADLCRGVINQRVGRIVRMFKWAVAEEIVGETVYRALKAVRGLEKGRCQARESEPVRPVAEGHARAVLPYLLPPAAAMVELQLLTGMRPGEVCIMRGCDLETSGPVWLYRPARHKTAHRGKARVVAIGPRAQGIIREFLKPNVEAYLFSPREAIEVRRAERRAARRSKVQPSQADRRKARPRRKAGERYTTTSYYCAIRRACDKADAAARALAVKAGMPSEEAADRVFVPRFHPHQVRHTHATEVRRRFGLEAAQVALGHAQANVTEVYAERDVGLAVKVAKEIG